MTYRSPHVHRRPVASRFAAIAGAAVIVALLLAGATHVLGSRHGVPAVAASTIRAQETAAPAAPTSPPVVICGNAAELNGPATPPAGAVTVAAGNDSSVFAYQLPANKTYWFAPGTHTLGAGEYAQISPGNNDRFIGAPGAILNGEGQNNYAFVANGNISGVVIEYLTITHFTPPGGNGAVGVNAESGWTFTHDTVSYNSPGSGVMLGTDNVLSYSCLTQNGEYGYQSYTTNHLSPVTGGASDITVTHNEVSYNDTYDWEDVQPGCGCSGGSKFWQTDGATITDNYVHDNRSVGIWADTDDNGFVVTGNYIAHNQDEGLMYEISYNALIENNTFVDNAWGGGPTNTGFPTGAIYLSESGGAYRVPTTAGITTITISGNTFTNNWSGVVVWENSNRFCGSPDNSSAQNCTLVDPSVANLSTCTEANLQHATAASSPPLYNDCRWRAQNIVVTENTFNMTDSAVPGCKGTSNSCGENGIFSEYCSNSSNGIGWSPYCNPGFAISNAMMTTRNIAFKSNAYHGQWGWMAYADGEVVSQSTWQGTWRQDAGSSFSSS